MRIRRRERPSLRPWERSDRNPLRQAPALKEGQTFRDLVKMGKQNETKTNGREDDESILKAK